jgi:hypothetical protein
MTWRPEDFDDLASHLRRQMDAEIRGEAEEVERLTELQRRRKQDFGAVAIRAMQAGDRATITIGRRQWRGRISSVGRDYLTLNTDTAVIEAPFTAVILSLERSRSGGENEKPASLTWAARLAELAMAETKVLLLTDEDELQGRIRLVASDHLEFEVDVYLMLEKVRAVIRAVV